MIECSNLEVIPDRFYGGSTGSKICVRYNDRVWMLKMQQSLKQRVMHNVEISYANDVISEYIGSHIYKLFDIPVHDTLLGLYQGRLCVLCSDDAYPKQLVEFKQFRNSIMSDKIVQSSTGMSRYLSDIFEVIYSSERIEPASTVTRFWIMFVLDALIGNTDRNNGNWAFTYEKDHFELYEVYDCGGCLNNKRSDEQMSKDLANNFISNLALNYTTSFRDENGKRINPFKYIERHNNKYIANALQLFKPEILTSIFSLIDSLDELISETRKSWYKEMLQIRFNKLLSFKNNINSYKDAYLSKYNLSEEQFEADIPRLMCILDAKDKNDLFTKLNELL